MCLNVVPEKWKNVYIFPRVLGEPFATANLTGPSKFQGTDSQEIMFLWRIFQNMKYFILYLLVIFFLGLCRKKSQNFPYTSTWNGAWKECLKMGSKIFFTIKLIIAQMAFILNRKMGIIVVLFLARFVLLSIARFLEFSLTFFRSIKLHLLYKS